MFTTGSVEVRILALRIIEIDHLFKAQLLTIEQIRGAGQGEDGVHRCECTRSPQCEVLGCGNFSVHHSPAVSRG